MIPVYNKIICQIRTTVQALGILLWASNEHSKLVEPFIAEQGFELVVPWQGASSVAWNLLSRKWHWKIRLAICLLSAIWGERGRSTAPYLSLGILLESRARVWHSQGSPRCVPVFVTEPRCQIHCCCCCRFVSITDLCLQGFGSFPALGMQASSDFSAQSSLSAANVDSDPLKGATCSLMIWNCWLPCSWSHLAVLGVLRGGGTELRAPEPLQGPGLPTGSGSGRAVCAEGSRIASSAFLRGWHRTLGPLSLLISGTRMEECKYSLILERKYPSIAAPTARIWGLCVSAHTCKEWACAWWNLMGRGCR